jgi:type II secretory pathway pseudopilin PulG
MKPSMIIMALGFIVISAFAADTTVTNDSEAAQQERLYQRFLKEIREVQSKALTNVDVSFMTNYDTAFLREHFKQMVVHPSFGYRWDEVPAPTMTGSNALAAVHAFITANGWDMQKDGCIFTVIVPDKSKPIRGLPWTVIHEREFRAVTHNGILYVHFTGWHHDCDGVAYNPKTNDFAPGIVGFKPIGQHWYVWAQTDPPEKLAKEYEGSKR